MVAGSELAGPGGVVAAGEQALGEGFGDQDAAVVVVGELEDSGPGLGREQVVADGQHVWVDVVEQLHEALVFVAGGGAGEPVKGVPVWPAHADRADEPLVAESAHGVDCCVEVGVVAAEVGVVEEVDVEVVGAEVVQGLFELVAHVQGLIAVCGRSAEVSDLGGDHDGVAGQIEVPEWWTGGQAAVAAHIGVDEFCFILASVYWSTVPCPRKLTKAEEKRGIRSYTPPTVAQFCEGADLADVIAIMGATGQRPSQVLGLAWPFYDRERRTIRTVGKVVRIPGKGLVRVVNDDDPKNPQGTIALPDFAVEVLDRRWELLRKRKRDCPPPGNYDVDLIFPTSKWTLRDPVNVNHQWQRVREALGLPDDVVPYSFRKLVAMILDDEGLSARVTADVLQHADPAMTQRKYMARGRVHHTAAAVVHSAVMAGLGKPAQDDAAIGRDATFLRLSCEFGGRGTKMAPDRAE